MKFDIYDPAGTRPSLRFVLGMKGDAPLHVIGINPSTACHEKSDRTIEKVGKLSRAWGYDGFVMLNLYPLRRTRLAELPRRHNCEHVVENVECLRRLLCGKSGASVWAAWGNAIDLREYFLKCLRELLSVTSNSNIEWLACGDFTKQTGRIKGGNPRHPNPREPLSKTERRGLVHFDFEQYLRRKLPH